MVARAAESTLSLPFGAFVCPGCSLYGAPVEHIPQFAKEIIRTLSVASMRQLLEAGVHFGHQTRRWNPKMRPYIYGERNGIYIIDLEQTTRALDKACEYIRKAASERKNIVFVGTKKQAAE